MKTMLRVCIFVLTAIVLASCAAPTNTNTNTNSNTNANIAAKPAAPTADSLMALEQKAWEAYKNKDGKFFEGFLAENLISGDGRGAMSRAEAVKMIAGHNEEIKSFSLSEPHVTPAGSDAVVLTYKGTMEGTQNGKALPSPVRVATVFVRSGSEWKAVYHNEVPIIDPAKMASNSNTATADDTNKSSAGPEKNGSTSPTSTSGATNSNATASNTNTNSASASTDAALTDALMAVEKRGWEAWKSKDAKVLDEITAKDFAFIDPTGSAKLSKADALKMWTTDNKCNVSSVALSDGKATSITKDAAILVVKGTAEGTCDGMKLEPLWNTTVFVKEGDVWKTAYIFEMPLRKS
jgi:ketosteroid isomerase-like protein